MTPRDDAPLPWRGLLVDVCRHWISPETLHRTLDAMALFDLNVLHLHLTDDQAHRVESAVWPRLHTVAEDGRYLRHDEVRALVDHAERLGIRVVPELDMPGHTTAWLAAYPHLIARGTEAPATARRTAGIAEVAIDPESDDTFEFVEGLIDEFAGLFPDSHVHLGGDEVHAAAWPGREIAAAQAAFTDRVVGMVLDRGRTPVVWDEAWHPNLDRRVVVQVWRGHARLRACAAEGRPVLLSTPYYLDLSLDPIHHAVPPRVGRSDWERFRARQWTDPMVGPLGPLAAALERSAEESVPDAPDDLDDVSWPHVLGGEACCWTELCDDALLPLRLWPTAAVVAAVLRGDLDHRASPDAVSRVLDDAAEQLRGIGIDLERLRHERWLALADGDPSLADDLAVLAGCCEPAKWYGRHALRGEVGLSAPLDRFVDSLPPRAAGSIADPEISSAASRLVDRLSADPSPAGAEILAVAAAVLSDDSSGELRAVGEIVLRDRIEEFPADL